MRLCSGDICYVVSTDRGKELWDCLVWKVVIFLGLIVSVRLLTGNGILKFFIVESFYSVRT